MRGADKIALVVALGDIVRSRQLEIKSSFSLRLSFDDAPEESHWTIGKPVRKIRYSKGAGLVLGISSRHSVIPMSILLPERGLVSLPFKTPESLHLFAGDSTSLEFLFIRDHIELTVNDYSRPPPPSSFACALPLLYTLRALVMKCDNPLLLAGHTFHKLERFKLMKGGRLKHTTPSERMLTGTETGMPACTIVDMDDPWVFATFKLPRIHELALDFSDRTCGVVWEKRLAVNANLSGLIVLHMKNWLDGGILTPILRSVPLLQTLIITSWGVDSLSAFLPMDANGTPELKRTSCEGKALTLLCPRLQSLQIEIRDPWVQLEQMPILRDIVTLRAECGSPLKVFNFSHFWSLTKLRVELIKKDGSFTMEKIVLPKSAKGFALDI